MTSMIFIHYARRSATGTQVLSGSISEGWLKRERGREDRESERASTLSTSVVECLPLSRLLAAAAGGDRENGASLSGAVDGLRVTARRPRCVNGL